MAERRPGRVGARGDHWPWILGGLARRPWAWLVVLMAVLLLVALPLMQSGPPRFRQWIRPEVVRLSELARSLEAVEAADADEPLSVSLHELAGPWNQVTRTWRVPPVEALRRVVRSGRNVVALDATGLPPTRENLGLLAGLPSLERLKLSGFVGSETVQLSGLPVDTLLNLRVLDLSGAPVDVERLGFLAALPRLGEFVTPLLTIDATRASELAAFPRLRTVFLRTSGTPAEAASALRPLLGAPALEEIYLDAGPIQAAAAVEAVQAALPGLTVWSALVSSRRSTLWLQPLAAAGVLSMLGLQFVLWTSGPLPATVPGFAAAHRRVAWVLTAGCVAAVTLSAWACGLPPWLGGPGVAAFFGVFWWILLRGSVAAAKPGEPARLDQWIQLTPYASLVIVAGVQSRGGDVLVASTGVVLGCVAVVSFFRVDAWLRGGERRPAGDRLESADREPDGGSILNRFATGDRWPWKLDRGHTRTRFLVSLVLVAGACFLALAPDAFIDEANSLWTVVAAVSITFLLVQPLVGSELRWHRRLATLACGVPLPGGRARQVRESFNGVARDHAGLLPLAAGTAACATLLATRAGLGLSPLNCGIVTFSLGVCLIGCFHGVTCLLWRDRVVSGFVLTGATLAACIVHLTFVINGRTIALWSLLIIGVSLLLALWANLFARRRELRREWG